MNNVLNFRRCCFDCLANTALEVTFNIVEGFRWKNFSQVDLDYREVFVVYQVELQEHLQFPFGGCLNLLVDQAPFYL